MNLLARLGIGRKIAISFGALIALIALNALVGGLAANAILGQIAKGREVEGIVAEIDQIRLLVGSFVYSHSRESAQQVFLRVDVTRARLAEVTNNLDDPHLRAMAPRLDDFKLNFQKFVAESDQKAALESRAMALGNRMMAELDEARNTRHHVIDHELLDRVVGALLSLQWHGRELQSRLHPPRSQQVADMKAQLQQLRDQTDRHPGNLDSQRVLFRLLRDASDYVGSFESFLRYQDINRATETTLLGISDTIQQGCKDIQTGAREVIRQRVFIALTLMAVIFVLSIASAIALARYLTREILKPVHGLVEATQALAAGDLDARASVVVDDEIGGLARAFNHMAAALSRYQDELVSKHRALEEAHEELEQRVQERTEQLAITNQTLHSEIEIRQQSEAMIRASEEKFRAMFELSPLGMARNSLDGEFIEFNKALLDMLGYTFDALAERRLADLTPTEYATRDSHQMRALSESGRYGPYEKELLDQAGRRLHVRMNGMRIMGGDGTASVWSIIEDITEQKRSEELIWQQANFDSLTGLPNRRMFQNRLDQEMKNARRQGQMLALMFLDLDKFKEVNDTLGHDKGDILLKEAARRISGCVRETDMVARLGGDEFTIILSGLDDIGNVDRIARKIIDFIALPFPLGEDTAFVGASIGITLFPDDASTLEELMSNADQAMYAAKEAGRNRSSFFTRALQESAQKRMRMINDLRGAISQGQFELHFQPIVELATGAIHKAEALIRWHHPERGLISPMEFIPLAEETRQILDIGDWAFREAARQVARLRQLFNPEFQISVNKSPVQFHAELCYTEAWFDYLRTIGLPGKSIVIEITEGLLLDASDTVKHRLLEYRDVGIQVSLDDFGTGYSSLAYLNRFDIDFIKIDQSFVRNLTLGSSEYALCEAITVMAHKLGLKVIAEGVETEQQRMLLAAAGCDFGQGYLFARPMPMREFEAVLREAVAPA